MFMILGVGLFNSVMWPTIFELGVHGLGKFTAYASSVLIMGIVGGAAVPLVMNTMIDEYDYSLKYGVVRAYCLLCIHCFLCLERT